MINLLRYQKLSRANRKSRLDKPHQVNINLINKIFEKNQSLALFEKSPNQNIDIKPKAPKQISINLINSGLKAFTKDSLLFYNAMNSSSNTQFYDHKTIDSIYQLELIEPMAKKNLQVISGLLPFYCSEYQLQLIDWQNVPNDPMFQLLFPQPAMLHCKLYDLASTLVSKVKNSSELNHSLLKLRSHITPISPKYIVDHTPLFEGRRVYGIQHKFRDSLTFFPSNLEDCNSYFGFSSQWFNHQEHRQQAIAEAETHQLSCYLLKHSEVSHLKLCCADLFKQPFSIISAYLTPLLDDQFAHVETITIENQLLASNPNLLLQHPEKDSLLELFGEIVNYGKQLQIFTRWHHPQQLGTEQVKLAIEQLLAVNVQLPSSCELKAGVNDNADCWNRLWHDQSMLGLSLSTFEISEDCGPQNYYQLPLSTAWKIYQQATEQQESHWLTHGPIMDTRYGMIEVEGIGQIRDEQIFILKMLHSTNTQWNQRLFYAQYDDNAHWLDQLQPAFTKDKFFFTL
ncbi:hypothetical protein [Pelagibaculum spongiae]|uniref:Uncharacterized protein n=1 Tax=Pelagibaculum spongiae TaxID=2080658 RepID=A0A2V1H4D7_9GAMM|nr:hypothetical protein [Pelagibaculum spongiae]PVZ72057.1 hypothetical protein DC094_03285 [Pelagibaculum spongiae]